MARYDQAHRIKEPSILLLSLSALVAVITFLFILGYIFTF